MTQWVILVWGMTCCLFSAKPLSEPVICRQVDIKPLSRVMIVKIFDAIGNLSLEVCLIKIFSMALHKKGVISISLLSCTVVNPVITFSIVKRHWSLVHSVISENFIIRV